ncbi:hypothetical protein G7K_4315-t1 [Saitoella complicata NRRL Y-17804]|uniref:Chromo domain-containing protein n=1 Tax=Saitoella complicata (strain BCRC 22490 / CBS 7301 / JCM 7358 / NBRC 10748 / NRRL Y-17804) TaxID=698492 RepID=A0A0E9NKF7_SAICN|nr:hypothetical protein G7K_4315-t1 [Saitoella complicata NRRL Y-17804]
MDNAPLSVEVEPIISPPLLGEHKKAEYAPYNPGELRITRILRKKVSRCGQTRFLVKYATGWTRWVSLSQITCEERLLEEFLEPECQAEMQARSAWAQKHARKHARETWSYIQRMRWHCVSQTSLSDLCHKQLHSKFE